MFQAVGYRVTYLAPAFYRDGTSHSVLGVGGMRFYVAQANELLVLQNRMISIRELEELDWARAGKCELLVIVPEAVNRPVAVMTAVRLFEDLLDNDLDLRPRNADRVFQDFDVEILGLTHVMDAPTYPCLKCGQPSTWVRSTQFAGEYNYCADHAEQEPDFGMSDPISSAWRRLESTTTV